METLTKDTAQAIHEEVVAAVKEVLDRHSLKVESSRCSWGDAGITLKLAAALVSVAGENQRFIAEWNNCCEMYGFTASDRGRSFRANGRHLTIVGLDLSRRRYPVVARDADGVERLFRAADVRQCLSR